MLKKTAFYIRREIPKLAGRFARPVRKLQLGNEFLQKYEVRNLNQGWAALALAAAAVLCANDRTLASGEPPSQTSLQPSLISDLKAIVGDAYVECDPEVCASRGKPWNSYHSVVAVPSAIVSPASTAEVAAVVKALSAAGVAIVPFGGGTSLEGHTLATRVGCVSLDFQRMKALLRVSPTDEDCTVQAGLGYLELNAKLKEMGGDNAQLWFPLDPGPGATIGGMCATRCASCFCFCLCFRFGRV